MLMVCSLQAKAALAQSTTGEDNQAPSSYGSSQKDGRHGCSIRDCLQALMRMLKDNPLWSICRLKGSLLVLKGRLKGKLKEAAGGKAQSWMLQWVSGKPFGTCCPCNAIGG